MRYYIIALLICCLFVMSQGCDNPNSPAEQPNRPAELTAFSPTQGVDGTAVSFSFTVTDPDGLLSVTVSNNQTSFSQAFTDLSGTSLSAAFEVEFNLENTQAQSMDFWFRVNDRDGKTHLLSRSFNLQPAEITNMAPTINVEVSYDRNWQDDEIKFKITAQDDFKDLDTIRLNFGDGNINEFNVGKSSIDTTLTHNYITGGDFDWNVLAKDTEGLEGRDNGLVSILKTYDVNITPTKVTYVGSLSGDIVEPDNTARMKFTSRDGSIVHELQAENGVIQGRIPEGEFEVEYLSDVSKASRMRVDRSFYPDEWQYLSYMSVDGFAPGDKSWVVRGYPNNHSSFRTSEQNWYFDVAGDINTRSETIKGAIADQGHIGPERFIPAYELLKLMTGQMNDAGLLKVPRTKDAFGEELVTYKVYNFGNSAFNCSTWDGVSERPETCPSMKQVEQGNLAPEDLPDGGVNPPGVIPRNPAQAEQNFDTYVNMMKEIFNSDIVAGNPYNIEIVKGYSHELTDYLDGWYQPLGTSGQILLVNPKDNVFFTSHNMGAGTEYYSIGIATGGAFQYTRASAMFVGESLFGFKNEATHWFSSREGLPCVYSIRDSTKGECGLSEFPSAFTDLDIIYAKISAVFGTHANNQKTSDVRQTDAADRNRDGLNFTLPRN